MSSILSIFSFTIISATSNFENEIIVKDDTYSIQEGQSSLIMVVEETQMNDNNDLDESIGTKSLPPYYKITTFITNFSDYQTNIFYQLFNQYQSEKSKLFNQKTDEEGIELLSTFIDQNNIKTENEKDQPLFLFMMLNLVLILFSCFYLIFCYFSGKNLILKRFNAKECNDPEIIRLVKDLSNELKLKNINIYLFDDIPNAFAFGFPGSIALSNKLITVLSKKELSTAIRHELAHIKNRDIIFKPILQVIRILFFYNPVIHILYHMILRERELIADSLFIKSKEEKISFIEALIKIQRYSNHNKMFSKSILGSYSLSLLSHNSKKLEINDRFNNLFGGNTKKTFFSVIICFIILFSNISMIAIAGNVLDDSFVNDVDEEIFNNELELDDKSVYSDDVKHVFKVFEDFHPTLYKKCVIYFVLLDVKKNDLSPREIADTVYSIIK
jgi:beta-lactamase regulating signal transducer with metallopeptidase domain